MGDERSRGSPLWLLASAKHHTLTKVKPGLRRQPLGKALGLGLGVTPNQPGKITAGAIPGCETRRWFNSRREQVHYNSGWNSAFARLPYSVNLRV